ncbi:MAG TPA: TfoX/Sxy family protein [Longimicrobiales bacterium]|nr:TfoX/Sxy family protein [Longimicrobiales bacterium]
MAYDDGLLERCRDGLRQLHVAGVRDKNAFGMRGLMLGKKMFAAVGEVSLLVKLTEEEYGPALERPDVRPFTPGGESAMGTWVEVDADAVADEPELREWLEAGVRGVRSL